MKLKKLFRETKMNWLTVILFAVITGVYTGLIMLVPFLKDTSFQDIGISYEFWVIFAVIVVTNCRKSREAMLKCFVFFLISQPLVYLVEIAAGKITLSMAIQYYRFWFVLTILCLPGGFIAFYAKKQNLFGSIVLGLGNSIQMLMGVTYVVLASRDFPHHILSALVSFASIAVMSLCIQKEKKYWVISALVIPLLAAICVYIYLKINGLVLV